MSEHTKSQGQITAALPDVHPVINLPETPLAKRSFRQEKFIITLILIEIQGVNRTFVHANAAINAIILIYGYFIAI